MIATCANKMYTFYPSASPIGLGAEITNQRGSSTVPCVQHSNLSWKQDTVVLLPLYGWQSRLAL
jgi:hypothetical protein